MSHENTLEPELVWQDDGHLTDVAVTALADGQVELLPESARSHAMVCGGCAERIGAAALMSLDAGQALEEAAGELGLVPAAPIKARQPLPIAAIAAALVLALLGVVPSLPILRSLLVQTPGLLLQSIPAVVHSAAVVLESAANPVELAVLWCAVAVMLMAAGLVVARLAPRHASKGEH